MRFSSIIPEIKFYTLNFKSLSPSDRLTSGTMTHSSSPKVGESEPKTRLWVYRSGQDVLRWWSTAISVTRVLVGETLDFNRCFDGKKGYFSSRLKITVIDFDLISYFIYNWIVRVRRPILLLFHSSGNLNLESSDLK